MIRRPASPASGWGLRWRFAAENCGRGVSAAALSPEVVAARSSQPSIFLTWAVGGRVLGVGRKNPRPESPPERELSSQFTIRGQWRSVFSHPLWACTFICIYAHIYIIYGFLVCRYASSLGLRLPKYTSD